MDVAAWKQNVPTYIALIVPSLAIGYYLGIGHSLLSYNTESRKRLARAGQGSDSDGESDENIVDDTDLTDSAMNRLRAKLLEECKLVLVVRTDLKMDKGKIAAQCSHATLANYKSLLRSDPTLVSHWERTGQTKVALKCASEAQMNELERTARAAGLCAHSIRDAGRTQIPAGSRTVLGVGPGPISKVDQVTGHLKLL